MSAEQEESRLIGERFQTSCTRDLLDYMGRIILSLVTLAVGLEVTYFETRKMVYSFFGGVRQDGEWGRIVDRRMERSRDHFLVGKV